MKIYLDSYLNNNLGDDLMIDLVCKRYSFCDFYVGNSNCLDNSACANNNLHVVKSFIPTQREYIKRIINKIISYLGFPKIQLMRNMNSQVFDLNLTLGGSVYMQVTESSWINKVRDEEYVIKKCKKNAVIGCNFGPFSDKNFKIRHCELFKKYDVVTFRDKFSYNLFADMENTKCYPDILFNLQLKSIPAGRLGISVNSLNNIGISKNKEKYIRGIERIISFYEDKYDIWLLSFCENEGDLDACEEIIKRFGLEKKISIYNHTKVEDSLEFLRTFNAMICTRFHASVLAIILGIPFVPIIYSDKTTNMLDDIGYNGYRWDIKNGNEVDLNSVIFQLETSWQVSSTVIEGAKGHLKELDSIICEREK